MTCPWREFLAALATRDRPRMHEAMQHMALIAHLNDRGSR